MAEIAVSLYDQFVLRGLERLNEAVASFEPESLHLEFKEWSSEWRSVLGKACSAFANVDGGVLIFGIKAKGTGNADDPRNAQSLAPVANVRAAERQVLDAVSDLLDPRIPGIMTHVIDDVESGTGYLIINVPASNYRPHQSAKHHSYFMRTGSNSVHMPDSVVRAMVLAGNAPDLQLLHKILYHRANPHRGLYWRVQLILANLGRAPATNVALAVEADPDVQVLNRFPYTVTLGARSIMAASDGSFVDGFPAVMYRVVEGSILPATSAHVLTLRRISGNVLAPVDIRVRLFADGFASTETLQLRHDDGIEHDPRLYHEPYLTSGYET